MLRRLRPCVSGCTVIVLALTAGDGSPWIVVVAAVVTTISAAVGSVIGIGVDAKLVVDDAGDIVSADDNDNFDNVVADSIRLDVM